MNSVTIIVGVRPHYVKAYGLLDLLKNTTINPVFFDVHQHYDNNLRNPFVQSNAIQFHSYSEIKRTDGITYDYIRQITDINMWLSSNEGKSTKAVIVLGDATPAMTGAIVANRLDYPLIHIEAGVRRIPTEKEHWNTIVADHLSSLRYCYTNQSYLNLQREGLSENTYMVGDILASWTINKASQLHCCKYENYVLVSIHRPQNCNKEAISSLCKALQTLKKKIVWILHPRTHQFEQLIHTITDVELISAQTHDSVLSLIKYADLIVTDSGGLIRESVLLAKPVVVCHKQGMWEDLIINNIVAKADMTLDSILEALFKCKSLNYKAGKQLFIQENGTSLFINTLTDFLNKL